MERAGSARPSRWVIGRALGTVNRKKYSSRGSLLARSKARWFYSLWWRTLILSTWFQLLRPSRRQTCASFGIWRQDCLLHWLSNVSSNYARTRCHTQESIPAKARPDCRAPITCTLSRGVDPFYYCLQNSASTSLRIQGPYKRSARVGRPFMRLFLHIPKPEYGMFHSFCQCHLWPWTKRYQLYSWNYFASSRASASSLLFYSEC